MKPFASRLLFAAATAALLSACGARVEVPPAHVGKIMTKDGYQDTLIPTSKFRLSPCWAYCDRLVTLDVADKADPQPHITADSIEVLGALIREAHGK